MKLRQESREVSRPSKTLGAVVGGLTVVGFTVVHDIWISDIWFNLGPMILAGAISGFCVVWSYNTSAKQHSERRWIAYNALNAGLLVSLGAVSLILLEPRFTMAEAMVMDDPLAELLPPAVPLMVAAMIVGTAIVWAVIGRRVSSLIPVFVTQVVLVFLIGHNLAILGLVELSGTVYRALTEFIGLTVFLAAVFAGGVMAGHRLLNRSARTVSA